MFKKIKRNFIVNICNIALKEKNHTDLASNLLKLKEIDFATYKVFAKSIIESHLNEVAYNKIFKPNLFWVAGFFYSDQEVVTNLISKYLKEVNYTEKLKVNSYANEIAKNMEHLEVDDLKKFDRHYDKHFFYQFLINELSNMPTILKTNSVFINLRNKYFTSKKFTKGFIYVSKSPYTIIKANSDQEKQAENLFNDKKETYEEIISSNSENLKMENYAADWSEHVRSWLIHSKNLNGMILRIEDLEKNPKHEIQNILMHLNKLDYNIPISDEAIDKISKLELLTKLNTNIQHDKITNKISKKIIREFSNELKLLSYT